MGLPANGAAGGTGIVTPIPGGSGSSQHYDAAGNLVDANGNIIKSATQLAAEQAAGQTFVNKENAAGAPGVFGNQTAQTILTKDNPVAGTLNAGGDIIDGHPLRAPGDFIQGTSLGTLPVGGNQLPQAGTAISKLPGAAETAGGQLATGVANVATGIANGIGGLGGGTPAPTPDANPGADFRQQQLDYARQLQATINGTAGPSAADVQGHNAQDRAIAQQFAAAQGATGANSALAYRQALQNAAGISQQAGADAATLRAKEVADAQGQLGGALNQGRSGDLTKYSTDVGAGNTRYAADKDFEGKKIAAITGAASGLGGVLLSDENSKTSVSDGDAEIAAMLDKLKAHKFQYKEPAAPGAAPGKRAGVMAQDLEKSMAGKALVIEAPDGTKGIDSPQAVGAMLAALASLHARTKRLEGRG